MVAYNFQYQFAELVETGKKRQTIRPKGRRRHALPGEQLQLYTGMRTKSCRKLTDAICEARGEVNIETTPTGFLQIYINGQKLNQSEAHAFSVADGFSSSSELGEWFYQRYGLPFEGVYIQW